MKTINNIQKIVKEEIERFVDTSLPIKNLKRVYHVGDMDINSKSDFSLEGSGLSVSVNPEEWRKIAQLGGRSLYELTKPNGMFVNAYRLKKAQRQDIIQWGVTNNYVTLTDTYRVYQYDEEGRRSYMEFPTYEKAQAQVDDPKDIKISKTGLLPTNKLNSETKQSKIDPTQTYDLLFTIFVEKTTNYDGIWWNDVLDVYDYSAPRGVIFNSKLGEWKINKIKNDF